MTTAAKLFTYSNLTDAERESFDCLWADLPAHSGYWLDNVDFAPKNTYDAPNKVMRLVLQDRIYPGVDFPPYYLLTKDMVLARLQGDVGLYFANHERDYFKRFGKDVLNGDFELVDYDADVTDVAIQILLFGKVLFA